MTTAQTHDPWTGVDPFDPAVRDNPYPFFARLREIDPVNETPIGIWRLTRYADVDRLLHEVPRRRPHHHGQLVGDRRVAGGPRRFMLQQDPPTHTRLRKLVSQGIHAARGERLASRHRAGGGRVPHPRRGRRAHGRHRRLALPVPSTLICQMMGVPLEDRARFTEWTAKATFGLAAGVAPPEVVAEAAAAGMSLAGYFAELVEARRASLTDDLLSALIRAEEAGDRLDPLELLSQAIGLLIAGFETTIGLIGNGVRQLILPATRSRSCALSPS